MKIHYFQRYNERENVATANTMLLLSRLYSYSPDKFFRFLKSEFFPDSFEAEIDFSLQVKSKDSIPDAVISQEGFKIVVETKTSDWFHSDQLINHLTSFGDEKCKILITLAPEFMANDKKTDFEKELKEFNKKQAYPVVHINTTFELLVNAVQDVIDDRDYEMQDVLDDFLDYCYNDNLITVHDSWKHIKIRTVNHTMDFDVSEDIYYDGIDSRRPKPDDFDYLGLYKDKSVRAIGKVCARITAVEEGGEIKYDPPEFGELTDERKEKILRAIKNSDLHGENLRTVKHRYFFVEKFYETDFRKSTPYGLWGYRRFDLTKILGTDELPDTEKIAEALKEKTWS